MSESHNSKPDELREAYSEIVPPLAPPDIVDPVIEAYKKDVDRTLIRENLKLTRRERLLKLENVVASLLELRGAVERTRRKTRTT